MDIVLRPWRLYGDLFGRARRTEFFLFYITFYGVLFVLVMLAGGLSAVEADGTPGVLGIVPILLVAIFVLAGIIPTWSVTIRRLHDQDRTGWLSLLTLVPYGGFIFMLIFGFWPGTQGENDYGPDPRLPDADAAAEIFA
jgi:uncharacterized membrane protein YhaH (DUF805 family)